MTAVAPLGTTAPVGSGHENSTICMASGCEGFGDATDRCACAVGDGSTQHSAASTVIVSDRLNVMRALMYREGGSGAREVGQGQARRARRALEARLKPGATTARHYDGRCYDGTDAGHYDCIYDGTAL
ncbi:MAG: hypothetical protein QM736_18230 [Vicinamibacterales bacterium]